jgi:hypothetical protein
MTSRSSKACSAFPPRCVKVNARPPGGDSESEEECMEVEEFNVVSTPEIYLHERPSNAQGMAVPQKYLSMKGLKSRLVMNSRRPATSFVVPNFQRIDF